MPNARAQMNFTLSIDSMVRLANAQSMTDSLLPRLGVLGRNTETLKKSKKIKRSDKFGFVVLI